LSSLFGVVRSSGDVTVTFVEHIPSIDHGMNQPVSYKRHRFPPQIIAHTVWLYYRFPLSLRLVEEMLHELGETGNFSGVTSATNC
jgi:hypothetical protein